MSAGTEGDIYSIPEGSIIVHKAGITTVYGPEREVMLSIADDRAGIVATPEGPARATHVHQVPSGSVIRDVDNKTTEVIHEGKVILTVINENEMREQRGIEHDWLECAAYPPPEDSISDLTITEFTAYWKVPHSPPSSYRDTRDFLFPAIQDSSLYSKGYPKTIIQPVLEWNNRGEECWNISSWTVRKGSADPDDVESYHSEPYFVAEGSTIVGTMCASPEGGWDITTGDLNTNEFTSIRGQLEGIWELWIYIALEGAGIEDDSNVPGDTLFYDIVVRDGYEYDITDELRWKDVYHPAATDILSELKVRRYSEPYDDCPPRTIMLETAN